MSSPSNPTRSRILKATLDLLENGEGSKVRMSDIAKAAKISRQALYLHYPNRAELLVETARYLDELHDIDAKLAPSRAAAGGLERLEKWVEAWTGYIPAIYGTGKALMAMMDSDAEARAAWQDRMNAVHHGCVAAIRALKEDGELTPTLTEDEAADLLFALLSVRTWEHLRLDFGWTQERYLAVMQDRARALLT